MDRRLMAAVLVATGCGLHARDIAFVRRDDVALDVPGAAPADARNSGEARESIGVNAGAIDGWVADVVAIAAEVGDGLGDYRETRRDGAYRLFGPFDDPDERELAWMFAIAGDDDAPTFEVSIGPADADEDSLVLALHGELAVDDAMRRGEVTLDLDVLGQHVDLVDDAREATLHGRVTATFEHTSIDGAGRIEIDFDDFVRDGDNGGTWFARAPVVLERDAMGGESIALVIGGTIDTPVLGALDVDALELDARYDASSAGRAAARLRAVDNPKTELPHGDFVLDECFDAAGGLTFRALNEAYAADRPDYDFGDASSCVVAAPGTDGS